MKFEGTGLIYSPKDKKMIINFKNTPVFETADPYIIDLLEKAQTVVCIDSTGVEESKEEELTKKELITMAKEAGIKGSDRMSKDAIIDALAEK